MLAILDAHGNVVRVSNDRPVEDIPSCSKNSECILNGESGLIHSVIEDSFWLGQIVPWVGFKNVCPQRECLISYHHKRQVRLGRFR